MQLGANSGHNSVKTAWLGKFWFSQNLGKFLEKPRKFVEKNEIFRFFSNLAGWILVGFAIQLEANNGFSGWDGDLVFSSSLLWRVFFFHFRIVLIRRICRIGLSLYHVNDSCFSSGHDLRSVCSFISRKVVNKYRHIIYGWTQNLSGNTLKVVRSQSGHFVGRYSPNTGHW